MDYSQFLPDDMIYEIFKYLSPSELVKSTRINVRHNKSIKLIKWPHTVTNINLLISSYHFTHYKIKIKPRRKYYDLSKERYEKIFANLNSNCTVTLYKMPIATYLLRTLLPVQSVKFLKCKFDFEIEDYDLLKQIKLISIVDCDWFNLQTLSQKQIQIKRYASTFIFQSDEEYLKNIKELDISNSLCTEQYWSLDNLSGLRLRYLNISDDDLLSIKNIRNIKKISLIKCKEVTDKCFQYLTNVENISLRGNFTDDGIKHIKCLKKIELNYCNNITDQTLQHFNQLTDAKIIRCDCITDKGLSYLKNAQKVTISGKFTDKGLKYLSHVKKLSLKSYKITDRGFKYLQGVKNLSIDYSWIDGGGFKYLTNVKKIEIAVCDRIRNRSLKYLANVKSVCLRSCARISWGVKYLTGEVTLEVRNEMNRELLLNLINVKKLTLNRCFKLNDQDLEYIKNVSKLKITHSGKITDSGLKQLAHLTTLTLIRCDGITNEGFKNLVNLKELRIKYCDQITKDVLAYLPDNVSVSIFDFRHNYSRGFD